MLNISLSTMKKFIYQGKIKTIRTPGGHHRIYRDDLFKTTKNGLARKPSRNISDARLSEITEGLMNILDNRLRFCKGHSASVSRVSFIIGQELRLSPFQLHRLRLAAFLHDIGKVRIDENILNKPSELTAEEYSVVKTHSLIGQQLLDSIKPFSQLSRIVRQHHERFDAKGYPDGLRGEQICMEAKVISLAEAFTSMTAPDSYKKPLNEKDALEEIKKNTGTQFDPQVAEVFFNIYRR